MSSRLGRTVFAILRGQALSLWGASVPELSSALWRCGCWRMFGVAFVCACAAASAWGRLGWGLGSPDGWPRPIALAWAKGTGALGCLFYAYWVIHGGGPKPPPFPDPPTHRSMTLIRWIQFLIQPRLRSKICTFLNWNKKEQVVARIWFQS